MSQALSSVSNLAIAVSVARVTAPAEYGAWALGYTAYALSLHITRAVASTPLMLSGDENDEPHKTDVSGSIVVALVTGILVGTLLVLGGLLPFADPALRSSLFCFAAVMPVLLTNDLLRYVWFRRSSPGRAMLMDATWLTVQILGAVALTTSGHLGLISATVTWGIGALASTMLAISMLRAPIRVRDGLNFARAQRAASLRLLMDSALVAGSTYVIPVIVAIVGGLSAAGYLRAGQTLMGGVNILVMGLTPVLTLESRRALARNVPAATIMWRWTAVLGLGSGLYGAVVLLLPDQLGEAAVGQSWTGASLILLPLVLQGIVRGPYTAGPILLKALGRLGGLVRLRFRTMIPSLLCPAVGVSIAGVQGAAWGLLASALITDLQCVQFLRQAVAEKIGRTDLVKDVRVSGEA